MANRPTAIILGARLPALGVVSCLSQAGIACVVCESRRYQAAWSRRAVFRRMPDPRVDPDAAAARVTDIAREFTSGGNLPVVIPTDDHFAILLAQNADSLSKVATLCCGKREAVTLFADQLRFASWAQEQDVNVPRSSSAKSFDKEMSFPIIVKPLNYSCFLGLDVKLPQGTRHSDLRYNRFDDAESWSQFRTRHEPILEHFVVQEFLPGRDDGMFWVGVYADRTATLRAVYVARKLRGFPAAYGNTVLGQNDTVPDGILNEVRSIVSRLEYTGVAEFEYRQNPKTGGFSLIEVNPRAWSWIMATKVSEANIPLLAYEDLSGNPIPDAIVNENPGRIKSILMFADLLNVFWRYRRDAPEWVMSPRKWWKSLKADKLVAIDVDGFDPLVTLYCAAIAVRNLIRNER